MLLVGLVTFEHNSEKSQVVSILCTWHLLKNQRKRAQWGPGGGGKGMVLFCSHKPVGPRAGKPMSPETAS